MYMMRPDCLEYGDFFGKEALAKQLSGWVEVLPYNHVSNEELDVRLQTSIEEAAKDEIFRQILVKAVIQKR